MSGCERRERRARYQDAADPADFLVRLAGRFSAIVLSVTGGVWLAPLSLPPPNRCCDPALQLQHVQPALDAGTGKSRSTPLLSSPEGFTSTPKKRLGPSNTQSDDPGAMGVLPQRLVDEPGIVYGAMVIAFYVGAVSLVVAAWQGKQ